MNSFPMSTLRCPKYMNTDKFHGSEKIRTFYEHFSYLWLDSSLPWNCKYQQSDVFHNSTDQGSQGSLTGQFLPLSPLLACTHLEDGLVSSSLFVLFCFSAQTWCLSVSTIWVTFASQLRRIPVAGQINKRKEELGLQGLFRITDSVYQESI